MDTVPITDLVTLAGFFSLVTLIVMQLVKPWVERLPGILLPTNSGIHDSLLRILALAINIGLLIAAWMTAPAMFTGLHWWDLLVMAGGQTVVAHISYQLASVGGATSPQNQPPTVIASGFQVNSGTNSVSAPDMSDFPTIPR